MAIERIDTRQIQRMPWKNGGGETVEVAVWPEDATLDTFEWRVSMASVTRPGHFSAFHGIDRTLAVLNDGALDFDVDGQPSFRLCVHDTPWSFPGDATVFATPVGGAVIDFNVMTRQGRWRHQLQALSITSAHTLTADCDAALLFCQSGNAECACAGEAPVALSDGIALLIKEQPSTITLHPIEPTRMYWVRLFCLS